MTMKDRLITTLPSWSLRALSAGYDYLQTTRADRAFQSKSLTAREPTHCAPNHFLLIVVDALRGDIINPNLTPFLASLDGTTSAIAPSPWTFPSVTSLFTGRYPHENGVIKTDTDARSMTLPLKIEPGIETLTEVLASAGYRTYGGFGHQTPFIALFGRFSTHVLDHNIINSSNQVLEDYISWRENREATRTFAYLHLADLHQPLRPPQRYIDRHDVDDSIEGLDTWRFTEADSAASDVEQYRKNRKALYRAAVDYVDHRLSEFQKQLPDETAMVVTADHGEAHWEREGIDADRFDGTGITGHGGTPYEPVARVPLLVSGLDVVTDGYVSLIDIVPTVLDSIGHPNALKTTGWSLLDSVPADRIPLIESTMTGTEKKAAYYDGWKLIASPETEAWFKIPGEIEARPPNDIAESLRDALPAWDEKPSATVVQGLLQHRLQKLGYQ